MSTSRPSRSRPVPRLLIRASFDGLGRRGDVAPPALAERLQMQNLHHERVSALLLHPLVDPFRQRTDVSTAIQANRFQLPRPYCTVDFFGSTADMRRCSTHGPPSTLPPLVGRRSILGSI